MYKEVGSTLVNWALRLVAGFMDGPKKILLKYVNDSIVPELKIQLVVFTSDSTN